MSENNSVVPVTVLMPAYNAELYIAEAIESILNQTYTQFELMIIDDGCTDGTIDIIKGFDDDRIKLVVNEKNLGLIATLNKGLDLIKTPFIARMDADDISLPTRLETQYQFMQNHPQVGACGTWYDNILPDNTERKGGRYLAGHNQVLFKNLYQLHIIHGTTMMRTEVIEKHNLTFNSAYSHAEDYDFFTRLAKFAELYNIPAALYKIRHHSESVSKKFSSIQEDNSNTVKQRIFKEIGVSVNSEQLNLYRELMHQNYGNLTGEKRQEVVELITALVSANEKSKYLPPEFLRKELSVCVMHLYNQNSRVEKKLFNSFKNTSFIRFSDSPKLYLSTYGKVLIT